MAARISPPQTVSEKNSGTQISVFDLGIRHLLLERGEIYYNNRKSELSADLHELTLQSSFALLTKDDIPGRFRTAMAISNCKMPVPSATTLTRRFHRYTREEFKLESAIWNGKFPPLAGCDCPQLFAASSPCKLQCKIEPANYGARLITLHCRMESSSRQVSSITSQLEAPAAGFPECQRRSAQRRPDRDQPECKNQDPRHRCTLFARERQCCNHRNTSTSYWEGFWRHPHHARSGWCRQSLICRPR